MTPESPQRPPAASLPDFGVLFNDLEAMSLQNTRRAAREGVRLGMGYAISCVDAAITAARAENAPEVTLWLVGLATQMRIASANLAQALDNR
jgi:hypothetical protein